MREDAWLVNVAARLAGRHRRARARAGRGSIAGAALDVTDPEPLPDGHPLWTRAARADHAARRQPGRHAERYLAELARENVRPLAAGEPLALADRPRRRLLSPRLVQQLLGDVAVLPALDLDLLALGDLVDREEVLDLAAAAARAGRRAPPCGSSWGPRTARRAACRPARPRPWCGTPPITRTGITQPGKVGARHAHHGVQRRALGRACALDEAVVGGIHDRGEQEPVELDRRRAPRPRCTCSAILSGSRPGSGRARRSSAERAYPREGGPMRQGVPRVPPARQRRRPRRGGRSWAPRSAPS